MNNRLADVAERVKARLDAIKDPITGKGLFTSGRIAGLAAREGGKVSFTIEAPPDVAELYAPVRERAEKEARAVEGVTGVIAVLTAETASAKAAGGVDRVKQIIAVASAKGGVGKSTVAVNLACAFASLGMKTGLLDLDVYGPSAPTLLGTGAKKPRMRDDKMLEPLEAHGLKTMSIQHRR
jgi:ATP-binding protein involved in chromosome partitioning